MIDDGEIHGGSRVMRRCPADDRGGVDPVSEPVAARADGGVLSLLVEFGVHVAYGFESVVEAATLAEKWGLAAVVVPDHYLMSYDMETGWDLPAYDALVQLGALARETSSIEIGTLVSPITFRHPAVLAKSAVTLDEVSDGRFKLGLGVGWMDEEHEVFGIPYPPVGERFDRLEEILGYLTAFFDPSHPGFEGDHYRLDAFAHSPVPDRPIPIMIGGGGPRKVPRLAGTFASEFNIVDVAGFDDMRLRIQRARQAAEAAGRDPDDLLVSTVVTIVGVDTQAELDDVITERARRRGMEPDELRQRIVDLDIPIGTWDQVYETLHTWQEVGFQRIYLPMWVEAWDGERAESTFEGVAGYS
jgi:alkanesulfonate monooxygenase SsuD/methylene tetrahydromethanopterin reductase-like flavin-dependent oxidoreductase (luciferase family)